MNGRIVIGGILWIGLVCLSLSWNIYSARKEQQIIGLQMARGFFDQILITRRWNAEHGGVYVPVSSKVTPNPYLEDPLRDIPVNDTLLLTKINPAFMTRQIAEIAARENGIQFHITSLKPIRPENVATFREELALRAFESGEKEVAYPLSEKEAGSFFYMAPLVTEKGCLNCHAQQGYKERDIRGGVSVVLPHLLKIPYMSLIVSHLLIGLAGLAVLLSFGFKLKTAYSQLLHQAVIDALTQIPNRRSFSETIMCEVNRSQREKSSLAVIMCDVDNFKAYNDTYGHTKGDDCLVKVAQLLKNSLQRPTDFCARYGGEEFVIILPNTSKNGGVHVAERMRRDLEELGIPHEKSQPSGVVSMSFGVSTREKTDAPTTHEKLIQQADTALYQAKANGRNRVEIYDGSRIG